MKEWFVHYTVTGRKCAEGPYTVDEAIDRRREIAKTAPDAVVSNKNVSE